MWPESQLAVANLLLPDVLIEYFELTKYELKDEELHFYFIENYTPVELKNQKFSSKNLFPETRLQDFSLPTKAFFFVHNAAKMNQCDFR